MLEGLRVQQKGISGKAFLPKTFLVNKIKV